jgi:hypothetical protein
MAWCRGHNADERGERDVALSDSDATNAMERARHSTRMREVAGCIRVSIPVALSTLHTCVVFNITLCCSILHDSIQRSKGGDTVYSPCRIPFVTATHPNAVGSCMQLVLGSRSCSQPDCPRAFQLLSHCPSTVVQLLLCPHLRCVCPKILCLYEIRPCHILTRRERTDSAAGTNPSSGHCED